MDGCVTHPRVLTPPGYQVGRGSRQGHSARHVTLVMLTAEAAASSDEDEDEDVAGNVGDRPERASAAGRGTG